MSHDLPEPPTAEELRTMAMGYRGYSEKESSRAFKRRSLIIAIALDRYAADLELNGET